MSIQNQDVVNAVKKHPIGFGCGFAAVVLAVAAYYRAGTGTELQSQLEQRTAEGQRLEANVKNAAGLRDQIQALDAAVATVQERAIDPLALAVNLQYFYELEAALGVRLIDLRQGTAAKAGATSTYTSVPYNVAIEGRYRQVLQFLQHLERGERLVRFNTVTITPKRDGERSASDNETEPLLTLSLTIDLLGRTSS